MVYYPLHGEYIAVGVLGILLYSSILLSSVTALSLGIKSNVTKLFFVCFILVAIFEYPRYFSLAIDGSYTSKTAYCFHIFAGNFFFVSFSIVCYQWSTLLEVGTYLSFFYRKNALIVANIVFILVDVISIASCATAKSLEAFFDSDAYIAFQSIEGAKNVLYGGVLSYFGAMLILKVWNYSQDERKEVSVWSEVVRFFDCCSSVLDDEEDEDDTLAETENPEANLTSRPTETVFLVVVIRLTYVLTVSTICFSLRVIFLVIKLSELQTKKNLTGENFAMYGVLWFCLSDFIPRVIPSLSFMYLMRTKRPNAPGRRTRSSSSRRSSSSSSSSNKGSKHNSIELTAVDNDTV
mmetsp:Transcript_11281/g.18469  ORF Transcript_11281/g.18469 Transcript_11281/m.18469 type:complete len:350 (-) Transcript_11281:139-1188(-)